MKNRLKAAMKSSISEILETMFFVSLEFDESGNFDDFIQSANGNLSASRLRFGGDLSGSFFFLCAGECAPYHNREFFGARQVFNYKKSCGRYAERNYQYDCREHVKQF